MKRKWKWLACFLVCAMMLGGTNAKAEMRVKDAQGEVSSGATVEKANDSTVRVSMQGEKGQEYVAWVLTESGIDTAQGRPTMESITAGQDGVGGNVSYMSQTTGDAQGSVVFDLHPNLERAEDGDQYSIYISTSAAGGAMTRIGSVTIEEVLEKLGDANADGRVDGKDISLCVDNFMKGFDLTETQKKALDVNRDNKLDGKDVSAIADFFMKGFPFS